MVMEGAVAVPRRLHHSPLIGGQLGFTNFAIICVLIELLCFCDCFDFG